jgi:hypothetical protein
VKIWSGRSAARSPQGLNGIGQNSAFLIYSWQEWNGCAWQHSAMMQQKVSSFPLLPGITSQEEYKMSGKRVE